MKNTVQQICAVLLFATLLTSNAFALTVIPVDTDKAFSDEIIEAETVSDWAKDGVQAARAANLIPALTGDPGYQDAITREQFAELAVQMVTVALGKAPDGSCALTFADCSNEKVRLASAAGIVAGVGYEKFATKQTTNREQIATMVARAIDYIAAESSVNLAPVSADISKFTDKGEVSSWAVEGVGILAANGIMPGTSAPPLSPKVSCTVEQSILLLYRVYEAYVETQR